MSISLRSGSTDAAIQYNGNDMLTVTGNSVKITSTFLELGTATLLNNFTLSSGVTSVSGSPLTINSGVTLTIPPGARLVVL